MNHRNDGRRAIDKQRALQHYSDQRRIAELEKALLYYAAIRGPVGESARDAIAKMEPQS